MFTPYKTPEAPTWPPILPSPGGLIPQLNPFGHLGSIDKSEWGTNEWQLYAQFLEESGSEIVSELVKTKDELKSAKAKSSRRTTTQKKSTRGLLWAFEEKLKRGREQGSGKCRLIANEALKLRAEKEARGEKITDGQVVEELLIKLLAPGLRQSRVKGQIPGVKNEMSRIRNNIK